MNDSIIKKKLQEKRWFMASKSEIRKKILACEDNGFLSLISKIENENKFGEMLEIIDYWRHNKISGVSLRVRSGENNQVLQSDFICWNQGNNPLCRGVILIEEQSTIKKLVLELKYNLVTLDNNLRTFAMSFPDFSNGQIVKLPRKIAEAIPGGTILRYKDLGEIYPEDSLIYGKTTLFVIIIKIDNISKINLSKVAVVDIEDTETLENVKDGYLLSIISRIRSAGII